MRSILPLQLRFVLVPQHPAPSLPTSARLVSVQFHREQRGSVPQAELRYSKLQSLHGSSNSQVIDS